MKCKDAVRKHFLTRVFIPLCYIGDFVEYLTRKKKLDPVIIRRVESDQDHMKEIIEDTVRLSRSERIGVSGEMRRRK